LAHFRIVSLVYSNRIFQIIATSGDSVKTAEEAMSEIPKEFVIILFVASLPIIVKGVSQRVKNTKHQEMKILEKIKKSKK